MKYLIIVESPVKIAKIKAFLPSTYNVIASGGHIMDLEKTHMALDLENDFKPSYAFYTDERSKKNISIIKKMSKGCDRIFIASDLDREGEFIGESVRKLLNLKLYYRIVFTEITKKAVLHAIANPIKINYNKIHAQQVRRFMDRIFGYGTTPLLKCIPELQGKGEIKGLGCGRVQNIVTKIIIDKEEDIKAFFNTDRSIYYQGSGSFHITINNGEEFDLETNMYKNGKILKLDKNNKIEEFMVDTLLSMTNCNWSITDIKKRNILKSPNAPYITSTLQCDASTKLHWSIKKTMLVAQKLYETGFITYMRTDSTTLSDDALNDIGKQINEIYGPLFHDKKQYECQQDNAQEAHECIRPTSMSNDTESMTDECIELYNLIWKRTMASQMAKAEIESSQIFITSDTNTNINMVGSKSRYIFNGYTIIDSNIEKDIIIPHDGKYMIATNKNIKIEECVASPPSRYNESQLVKQITKLGIGRPSTYVAMISKIQDKDYVRYENVEGQKKKLWSMTLNKEDENIRITQHIKNVGSENKRLVPTELGMIVNNFLIENFPQVMDTQFTANLEKQLDRVVDGDVDWLTVLHNFYDELKPQISNVSKKYGVVEKGKKDNNFLNNVIVGQYEGNDIIYFKCKGKFVIKCTINEKDVWANVMSKPTADEAIKLIDDSVNNTHKPKTMIIKKVGKYTIRKNIENEKIFIETGKVKKNFYKIYDDIDPLKITGKECAEIENKYKKIKKYKQK